jgi:hypothetical protein
LKDKINILEAQLAELEEMKNLMLETSIPVLVASNLPKIKPESARKETGVNVGTAKDINPGMLSNNGVSVEKAAEMLMDNLFYEGSAFPEIDMQEIRNHIIDILQTGVNNFINSYINQNEINELKAQIFELKKQELVANQKTLGELDISLEALTETDLFNAPFIEEVRLTIEDVKNSIKDNPELKKKIANFMTGTSKIQTKEDLENLKKLLCQ